MIDYIRSTSTQCEYRCFVFRLINVKIYIMGKKWICQMSFKKNQSILKGRGITIKSMVIIGA